MKSAPEGGPDLPTTFYWTPLRRWVVPAWTAFLVLVIVALWALTLDNRALDWPNPLLFWLILWPPSRFIARRFWAISHGVLTNGARGPAVSLIPLSQAELCGKRLSWPEGRSHKQADLPSDPRFIALVETALADCPEGAPRSEKAAAQILSAVYTPSGTSRRAVAAYILVAAGIAAGIWLNQPLCLLPMAAIPALLAHEPSRYLVLTPDSFWIAETDREPICIDRNRIKVEIYDSKAYVYTPHPDFPRFKLNRFKSTDLLRRLQYGDTTPAAQPDQPAPPAEPRARCTLCGRPLEGTAHPGAPLICDRCSERARLEAAEGGHGLTGRDPKPM